MKSWCILQHWRALKTYVKWTKPDANTQLLCDSPCMRRLEWSYSEGGRWNSAYRSQGKGNRELFSFEMIKKSWEWDGGDGCTKMWIYSMLLTCTLNNYWNDKNFMLCVFFKKNCFLKILKVTSEATGITCSVSFYLPFEEDVHFKKKKKHNFI